MIYLGIFWLILLLFLVSYSLSKLFKKEKIIKFFEREGALIFISILLPLIFIAIITKDPIYFGNFEIPTELQWLGSLFASFFGAWQFYLKPLKNKVFSLDREIGEVKTKINSIDSDIKIMKDVLISGKVNCNK